MGVNELPFDSMAGGSDGSRQHYSLRPEFGHAQTVTAVGINTCSSASSADTALLEDARLSDHPWTQAGRRTANIVHGKLCAFGLGESAPLG